MTESPCPNCGTPGATFSEMKVHSENPDDDGKTTSTTHACRIDCAGLHSDFYDPKFVIAVQLTRIANVLENLEHDWYTRSRA